jgi:GDPmannose 4,6-dehydratase
MQWLMLQQKQPEDFVIATGQQHSVRDFITLAASELGITLQWKGKGARETGIIKKIAENKSRLTPLAQRRKNNLKPGDPIISVDPRYFRPTEVDTLLGDPSKAKKKLGWEPRISFEDLVREMVSHDLEEAQKDELCKQSGFTVYERNE